MGEGLVGLKRTPLPPYSQEAMAFLADWSRHLLSNPEVRAYPDAIGFAYWCRAANLARLQREFREVYRRLGRGLALHIAPANVPVNFAFSYAFGLLAGNANIVRVPESLPTQASLLVTVAAQVLTLPQHARIAAMTSFVRYPRNDVITQSLSALADVRLLWGGDQTVRHLRAMPAPARCLDITFADRYSLCLLGAPAVLAADDNALQKLAQDFYNDVFLLDQNACSSPHLVLWQGQGDTVIAAQTRFWQAVETLLDTKAPLSAIHAVDKYTHLCRTAIRLGNVHLQPQTSNQVCRVTLPVLPADIADYRGRNGFFFESTDNDLLQLQRIVDVSYQTITCFGVDIEGVLDTIVTRGLPGIDRVVPVGKALDIGVVWDGYDLIRSMSRIVNKY